MWISRREYQKLLDRIAAIEVHTKGLESEISWHAGRFWPWRLSIGQPVRINPLLTQIANKLGARWVEGCEGHIEFKDEPNP